MPKNFVSGTLFSLTTAAAISLALSCLIALTPAAEARRHSSGHSAGSSHSSSHSSGRSGNSSRASHSTSSRHGHSAPVVAHGHGRRGRAAHAARVHEVAHHGRHHVVAHQAPKTRYAYPIGIFMKSPPAFDSSPLAEDTARDIERAFDRGTADSYPARTLVRAGIVKYHPLHGGIFWRREPVKYIVMHSTETGIPLSAVRVIESWSSMGIRHPGAQYVVDRDGTIYQAVDPELATVHVNIFKTLPGINNDNSIGIEMNHTGSQNYPQVQRDAVIKLVGYLKRRYNIEEGNIITHRYAQQGDHTDPVNFDWDGFLATVGSFHNQAIAYRSNHIKDEAKQWKREPEAKLNTYLKPHKELGNGLSGTREQPPVAPPTEPVVEPVVAPAAAPAPDTTNGAGASAPVPASERGFEKNSSVKPSDGDDVMEVPAATPAPSPAKAPLPGANP
ncbi:MAG: N-acetylmuramoyl-L-alanine amidase [Cyanobacteria bacterium SZAS LIN-3]|nr:N-acetylmuramoyl-L-alanine amidase [Cyanobacteria bacterium SZAS LIN-3]